jgi:hypothetical protein
VPYWSEMDDFMLHQYVNSELGDSGYEAAQAAYKIIMQFKGPDEVYNRLTFLKLA